MKTGPVLIVEDNKDIREMYAMALELAGLTVITAENGQQGIELALREHPSVILMDIMMPDVNGQKAVEKIREDAWGKNARIIYLTNLTEPEHVVEAFEQKPEEYIIKLHTDVSELVNKVRIAMHKA